MNQQDVVGALADGSRYRATSYLVELTDPNGAVLQTVDMQDVKSVQRRGQRVTIGRKSGGSLVLDGVSLDDAGRLETILRQHAMPVQTVTVRKGGVGRFLLIGCGGLIGLFILLVVVVALATRAEDDKESASALGPDVAATTAAGEQSKENEATLAAGQSATADDLRLTILEIQDPYIAPNQFSRPSAGNRFVAFKVQFENMGNRNTPVNAFDFKLIDAEDFQHNFATVVFDQQSLVGQAQSLTGGSKLEGWIGFEVKDGVGLKELNYDPDPFSKDDHRFRAP